MVVCPADHGLQADIIFLLEATAVNGAYINDLKTNYIIPSLEYFSQGNIDENVYLSEEVNSYYGVVTYQASDCLPHPCCDTMGPFSGPTKLLTAIEKLELIGGKGESHANIAEGLATALQCFEELQQKREGGSTVSGNITNHVQKHCILVCNSPPYSLPVFEAHTYSGKTAEQLAGILQDKNINLSIISPRKIPSLYKLFEKAGGDLATSQAKNYAKDPRHLVLLRGFSLKERPVSPQPSASTSSTSQPQIPNLPTMTSMPSPLPGNDSPISQSAGNVGVGQSPIYRPQAPQMAQNNPAMVANMGMRNPMMGNAMQQLQPPPGYQPNRPRWTSMPPMPPPPASQGQQRPTYNMGQNPQGGAGGGAQGSALIAQLTQPPSICPPPQRNVNQPINQFGQMGNNSPLNQPQQQQQQPPPQMKMSMMNPQTPGNMAANIANMQQNSNGGIQQQQQVQQPNQVVTSQAQNVGQQQQQQQQLGPGRDRHSIWQGLLEWIEKPKNPTDQQKVTKHVPCQVSANIKDGEPELKADGWPNKLIMQLMPKQLIGNIGGVYLKNSKSVLFHPQPCEALDSLTKVMSSGFAGCVHFTSIPNPAACDIKVLILLYTAEKRAYLGFIPNDQGAFVDRLRKVIQQQKSTQIMRQSQGGVGGGGNSAASPGGPNLNPGQMNSGGTPPQMPATSQQTQGMMISQTNTMTMGGGQITQNPVVPQSGPQMLGPQGPGGGPSLRMPMSQQPPSQQTPLSGGPGMGPNPQAMMGAPPGQRAPFENQLQAERQHNLEKINQLKQTLEAAQQQEQQYKSQLERISHMKTSQLQEALQIAQQTEMKYKILDQQRMATQGSQQMAQQQRMMRPVMGNNPGLRHLLQQQPQYRQQMMGMQQMAGNPQRAQLGQQMLNPQSQNPGNFDDVPYDFMQ